MISSRVRIVLTAVSLAVSVSLVAQPVNFKIATVSPDGSASMIDLRSTLETIETQSNGGISFRVYAGGVMGDDTAILRKMNVGQLHGGILQTGAFERLSDSIGLYNLPMVFRDFDEVTAVRAKLDQKIIEQFKSRNLTVLGFVGLGFANAMSKHPKTSMGDARALKVWSPKGDEGSIRLLQAFGITPTPLSIIDVLTGLQTGLIDTVAGPPVQLIALQWHTQVKYRLELQFMYIYSVFVVSSRTFNKLSEQNQELMKSSIQALLSRAEQQNYADHSRAIEALEKQGVQTLIPSSTELEEWRTTATAAAEDWVDSGNLDRELVDALVAELAAFRAKSDQ